MTMATLITKKFNWGGSLTVSEVQSIIITVGSMAVCIRSINNLADISTGYIFIRRQQEVDQGSH